MKTKLFFILTAAALFTTACSNDDDADLKVSPATEQASVNFELDASMLAYNPTGGLRFTPSYTPNGFSIYAFRQVDGSADYMFEKIINMANMTYRESDRKLVGNDLVNIGTYKFIAAYGLNQAASVLNVPTFSALNDSYRITYQGGTTPLGEIFLANGNTASLTEYELGINATNPTVTATLERAVSRVDIMFFKGRKNDDGTYTELPYNTGNNVFGTKTIEQVQLRYRTLNNIMSFFGDYHTTAPMNTNIELGNFANIITIGDGDETIVGDNATFDKRYDAIVPDDIIYGGAHIFGNYLFPNTDDAKTTGLEIFIKPVGGIGRTINVSVDDDHLLPIERNKVTLVKIYVLDNGPGPGPGPGPDPDPEEPTVFTTNVQFEVEIITAWDGNHEVTGDIQ